MIIKMQENGQTEANRSSKKIKTQESNTSMIQNVQAKKKPAKQVAVENESGMQIWPEKTSNMKI